MEQKEFQEKLGVIREEINHIDEKLLPLFLQRMDCSERVAELKRQADMPVLSPQREQEILERVRKQAGSYGDSAAALYAAIMAVSRARQHQMLQGGSELRALRNAAAREFPQGEFKIVCQGVEGAYSHKAARAFFGEKTVGFLKTFQDVFEEIQGGRADFGVLPVENSAAGSVSDVYDLILRYRFYIVGAVAVGVRHCLAAPVGTEKLEIVLSHPQALAQCSEYISAKKLTPREYSNTAAAAQYIAREKPAGVGVICSKEAAEKYGLCILEDGIQNEKKNETRFVVISRRPVLPEEGGKISLCFSLPHVTGSLYNVLERFAVNGLNLTKIESRPMPQGHFEYDFYLDFTGNIHDENTLNLICSLHDELPRFSFLGNYRELSSREIKE